MRPSDARLHSASVGGFPLSRHEWLMLSNAASAPSVRLPQAQGICIDIEVQEQTDKHRAESSKEDAVDDTDDRLSFPAAGSVVGGGIGGGVRLVPSRVRTWLLRDKHPVAHEPLLEWAGVQFGNVAAIPRPSHAAPRLQWRAQQYAVRCGTEELASDSSFAVRWRLRNNVAPVSAADDDRTSSHLSANLGAVLNVRKALAPPLPPPPAAGLKPSKPVSLPAPPGSGGLADLVAVSATIGYDTPSFEWVSPSPSPSSSSPSSSSSSPLVLRRKAHQVRSQLFAANDGMLIGGNVLYSHHARSPAVTGPAAVPLLPPSSFASFVSSLPRVSLGPSSVGLEFAWVQALKDFTLGIGVQQKFRWVAPPPSDDARDAAGRAVAAAGSLDASTAASRDAIAAAAAPLSTVSLSFQALGHMALSLHVPLTPRLSVASLAHVQLTNLESRLQSGVRYHLNDRHVVGVAADTAGGLQCAIARGPSSGRRQPHSASLLSWLSRHVSLELRAQAFPLWPALMPSWNQQRDGVMGADYSPAKMMRNQQQQFQIGGSVEINF